MISQTDFLTYSKKHRVSTIIIVALTCEAIAIIILELLGVLNNLRTLPINDIGVQHNSGIYLGLLMLLTLFILLRGWVKDMKLQSTDERTELFVMKSRSYSFTAIIIILWQFVLVESLTNIRFNAEIIFVIVLLSVFVINLYSMLHQEETS